MARSPVITVGDPSDSHYCSVWVSERLYIKHPQLQWRTLSPELSVLSLQLYCYGQSGCSRGTILSLLRMTSEWSLTTAKYIPQKLFVSKKKTDCPFNRKIDFKNCSKCLKLHPHTTRVLQIIDRDDVANQQFANIPVLKRTLHLTQTILLWRYWKPRTYTASGVQYYRVKAK